MTERERRRFFYIPRGRESERGGKKPVVTSVGVEKRAAGEGPRKSQALGEKEKKEDG